MCLSGGDFLNVIVCLDDNNGMLFNNRRQSRDKKVLDDIFSLVGDKKLFIAGFSEKLFSEYGGELVVDDSFLNIADNADFCFVENCCLQSSLEKIEKIIVYKWNRVYPADFVCDIDFSLFSISEETELVGNSHEKITRLIYERG